MADAYMEELEFYRQFHRHPMNWWLHVLCIPIEWLTWLCAMAYLDGAHWPAALAVGLYQALVVRSYPLALACILAQVTMAIGVDNLMRSAGAGRAWILALGLHILSWGVQVLVGHHLIEQNKPGMADRLTLRSIILSVPMAWDARKMDREGMLKH